MSLDALIAALSPGTVLAPRSDGYTTATSPDNSSFEQRPAAVVRPRSADDVAAAVTAARDAGLKVTVQSTGHGAGAAVGDDTVLIDTSALKTIQVDAGARTVRVGAGVVWGDVQKQVEQHGLLALSGTSPTVGVAGYTISGGGVGWLARPHGLASASLRSVEYVDGTGTVHRADDTDGSGGSGGDALWAFRGGTSVGIVTELEFDLFPVDELWAGYLLWPAERLPDLARVWLEQTAAAPDSLTSDLALLNVPPEGPFPDEVLGTVVVHLSYASPEGEAGPAAMRAAMTAVAAPVTDTTGPVDAGGLAGVHLDPPSAVPARGTGLWLGELDADALVSILEAAAVGEDGGLNMIEVRHVAPAPTAPADVDGALTTVPGPFLLHAVGGSPTDDGRRGVDAVLARVEQAAAPMSVGLSAPSFREGQPDAGSAHPPEVTARLRTALAGGDPDGVFAFQRAAGAD